MSGLLMEHLKRVTDLSEERGNRIATLDAQNKRLVEALQKIKRQDPYTTTNKSYFDFIYNTAKEALREATQ